MFLKIVQQNYDFLVLQIGRLLSQIQVTNIFMYSNNNFIIELNRTTLLKYLNKTYGDELIFQKNSFQYDPLSVEELSKISNLTLTSPINNDLDDDNLEYSYLDKHKNTRQSFQWWQVYKISYNMKDGINLNNLMYKQNYDKLYNLYCFQLLGNFNSTSLQFKLCLLSQNGLKDKLQNVSNKLFIKTQRNEIILVKSFNNTLAYHIKKIETNQNLFYKFQTFFSNQISPIYPEYELDKEYFLQCLTYHQNFYYFYLINKNQIQIIRCYNNDYFHLFTSSYILAWSIFTFTQQSYHKQAMKIKQLKQFQLQIFIYSNNTYYNDIHKFTYQGIQNMEIILQILFAIFLILIISFEMSNKYVKQILLGSVFMIKRIVKLIKSTQDVKSSQIQFEKLILQIQENQENGKQYIFDILPCYFEKFLWIKKLYYFNSRMKGKKLKKRQLLLNGLRLFKYQTDKVSIKKSKTNKNKIKLLVSQGNQNKQILKKVFKSNYQKYPSVLLYIYQELIQIEEQKIKNLKNFKMIAKKHKTSKNRVKQDNNYGQMRILNEIQNTKVQNQQKDQTYTQYIQNIDQKGPQISILEYKPKQNKGVRFSQDIQLKAINQKKTPSLFHHKIRSNSSINKKTSLKSLKSIQIDNTKKKIQSIQKMQKSQQDSVLQKQNKMNSKQVTIKNILYGQQSIHQALKSMKLDQSSTLGQHNRLHPIHNSSQIFEQCGTIDLEQNIISQCQITLESIECYELIICYYQELIQIKKLNLESLIIKNLIQFQEQEQIINDIYRLQVHRLKAVYKLLKIILKQSLNGNQREQINLQDRGINYDYQHLSFYEQNYQILGQSLQNSLLYKMKICICLGKTISYKNLQELNQSQNLNIKLESNYLFADQLYKLQPFLNFQVINKCYQCLCQYQTTIAYKRKTIDLYMKTLIKSSSIFQKDVQQLKLIKRFYNQKHKKFYFIADMTESYDIFTPILNRIYELMGRTDYMQIYNLGMDGNKQDMLLVNETLKPKSMEIFLSLFEQLSIECQKSKEKNSSKLIHKRLTYQKDFNQILKQLQQNKTDFSSFLIVILGADLISNHSSILADDVDSSNNQRQINQILYNEINQKIQKNYYHILLLGTNLSNFQTKQGKLKKHIKNSFDLLEIDLIKQDNLEHFIELEKFIGF